MMKTIDDDDDDDESWREGHKATSVVYEASTKQMKLPRVAKCCKMLQNVTDLQIRVKNCA